MFFLPGTGLRPDQAQIRVFFSLKSEIFSIQDHIKGQDFSYLLVIFGRKVNLKFLSSCLF